MEDDSLAQVVNIKSSTGRAITPQLKRHNITPQRNGSATRSKSNPKNNLTQTVYESQACNRKLRPNASKRIKQRWENDNLFGLRIFLSKLQINNEDGPARGHSLEPEDEEWNDGRMVEINWQNLFSEIMLPQNSDALKAYLACSTSFLHDPSSSASLASSHTKTFQDCVTEWERAEFAWNKVEKRLRNVTATAILNQSESRNFILILEDILLEMDAYLDRLEEERGAASSATAPGSGSAPASIVPFIYSIPHEMEHYFARPIKVTTSSKQIPILQITLRDSPYSRLLLHATCQFHGRNSKSYTENIPNTKKSFRVTHITSYASRRRGSSHHTISLVPFILTQHSSCEDSSSSASSSIPSTSTSLHQQGQHQLQQDEEDRYEIVDIAL